jgi:integrase
MGGFGRTLRKAEGVMGKLTALQVERLGPGLHADGNGLYLQVTGAARSWLYRYKLKGKERYHGLGSATAIALKRARELADDARRLRAEGIDPIEHRRAGRTAERVEAAKAVTFRQAAEQFIASHEVGWKNPKHRQQWRNTLKTYAYPVIGNLPVAEVDTTLMMKVLAPIWPIKPETASRVRGRIEVILDAAKTQGQRSGENPARWKGHLANLLPAKRKVRRVRHHPALPYRELPTFMAALRTRPSLSARALEFCILTAVRSKEAKAHWREIDLAAAVWEIPAERMKRERRHRVPLVGRALEILKSFRVEQRSGAVFPGIGTREGQPMSEAALGKMLDLMGDWRDENGDLITVHGFRSTFRDWAAERTSFAREVAEVAIAHAVGDETYEAYQRGDLFEKRRRLMEAWAKYCNAEPGRGSGKGASNVVTLRG